MKRRTMLLTVGSVIMTSPVLAARPQPMTLDEAALLEGADVLRTRYGQLEYMEGDLSEPMPELTPADAALNFMQSHRHLLPGDPSQDYDFQNVDFSIPGMTHVVLSQSYQGVPVYYSHLVVSLRGDNSVFRTWGKLFAMPSGFSISPRMSYDAAEDVALSAFGRRDAEFADDTELVIVPDLDGDARPRLAYRVHLFADQLDLAKNEVLLIDANNGQILSRENRVCSGTPSTGSGIGVWGDVKTLRTHSQDGTYYLADATRPMYNATKNTGWVKTYVGDYSTSTPYSTDPDNNWTDPSQAAEVDAHFWAGQVYDYYYNTFGWNSYDNKGSDLKSYTHIDMNNAYWSGTYMAYGEGDGVNFYNFAGDVSVAAHEMTHGVTQYRANLQYMYSSGALNEAFSDIMGKMEIDTDNWLIGDLVATEAFMDSYGIWALRDMYDPTFGGLYNPASPLSTMAQPDHMSIYAYLSSSMFQDYGGVHINSGIINKMAQLMADGGTHYGVTVPMLGRQVTARIFFTVNSSSYLATTSDFDHFATQVQKATSDLYGANSAQVTGVVKALQAVGLLSVGCVSASEVENNGSTSSANAISTSCTDMVGYMSSSSDKDYFKVSLPSSKTLSAMLRVPYPSDFDLYLYKGSTLVTKSVNTGNGQDEQLSGTNTGSSTTTYYLLVKRYAGSTGSNYKYTLNVKW